MVIPPQHTYTHTCGQNCIAGKALHRPPYLSNTHVVPALVRRHLRHCRQRRQRLAHTAFTAQQVPSGLANTVAEDQFATLKREVETIRSHRLSAPSSLAVYKMTVLCKTSQQQSVLDVFAQVDSPCSTSTMHLQSSTQSCVVYLLCSASLAHLKAGVHQHAW